MESRVYHTVYGDWYYFTVADDAVDPEKHDYLYIGTLESFEKMREYFGSDTVVPIYVEVEDGVRLERALKRERERTKPGYAEMCRRFLTDEEDFSEEKLAGAGIRERFENVDGDACFEKIREMILLCQK